MFIFFVYLRWLGLTFRSCYVMCDCDVPGAQAPWLCDNYIVPSQTNKCSCGITISIYGFAFVVYILTPYSTMTSYERSPEQLVGRGWAKAEIAAEKGFGNLMYLFNEAYSMYGAGEQEIGPVQYCWQKIEEKVDCPQYGTATWVFFAEKKTGKRIIVSKLVKISPGERFDKGMEVVMLHAARDI